MDYIITESQLKLLIEDNSEEKGMSVKLRRRLANSLTHVEQDLEWYVDDEMDPCQYSSIGEFVAEACDYLKDLYIDNIVDVRVSPKDKDALFHFFVDNYGHVLHKIYRRRCVKGYVTESKENKLEKYVVDYLNSLDLIKQQQGPTSYIYSLKDAPEYDWSFMVWDEDYIDEDNNIVRLRRLHIDPKLYSTIKGLFNISEERYNELILNWFNETYNEKANDLIPNNEY